MLRLLRDPALAERLTAARESCGGIPMERGAIPLAGALRKPSVTRQHGPEATPARYDAGAVLSRLRSMPPEELRSAS